MGDEVGQGHFGGRDQPPAVGGLVAVLGELRQLAGAVHRLVADQHRGPDLGQPVFFDVGVEHELGERAVDADHRALHHHEARARQPAGGLEVEPGAGGRDLVVLERRGREVPRAAPAVQLDVGAVVGAVGDVRQRQVRHALQQVEERRVGMRGLGLEPADRLLPLGDQRAQPLELGLVAARLGRADLLARRVPLGECGLGGGDPRPPRRVEREHVGGQRREAAARQRRVEGQGVVADQADVVHRSRASDVRGGLWPTTRARGRLRAAPRRRAPAAASRWRGGRHARPGRGRGRGRR